MKNILKVREIMTASKTYKKYINSKFISSFKLGCVKMRAMYFKKRLLHQFKNSIGPSFTAGC